MRMLFQLLSRLTLIALLLTSCIETYPRELREKQELMAQELGVKVNDYGPAIRFPWGYLRVRLIPGMSVKQVHQIIPNYEAVYRCETDSIPSEIYYFFSKDDDKALRIEVVYDEHKRYQFLRPEDKNSAKISVRNCEPGYLDE